MAFQIRYTDPAIADLKEIIRWSWENHPDTSERFGQGLINRIELLKSFPELGAPTQHGSNARQLLHWPLYIYYRIYKEKHVIEVLRLLHASRRPRL
ncbi:MAG TPA: type II toxin-antitoxin system RelE/ParE family toxin [Bryobacteraceae bacterium]|jgi:plasmid stabilization system protein ParE